MFRQVIKTSQKKWPGQFDRLAELVRPQAFSTKPSDAFQKL